MCVCSVLRSSKKSGERKEKKQQNKNKNSIHPFHMYTDLRSECTKTCNTHTHIHTQIKKYINILFVYLVTSSVAEANAAILQYLALCII